jgi:thiol-disulfide isomerase/thioredoxin
MKYIILFLISNFIYAQSKNEGYKINGQIEENYKGYIYLEINNKRDSCLVVEKKFYFEGKTSDEIVFKGRFYTNFTSGMQNEFYIENKNISILLSIERKKYNTTEYDFITIKNCTGTETSLIQNEYDNFAKSNAVNWNTIKYRKIDEIVSKYPKNQYSGSILYQTTFDSIVDVEKLKPIFHKLDTIAQDTNIISGLKEVLYPRNKILINSLITDFELPDKNNINQNTIKYRGKVLLIDFWASWCAPCRKKIPALKKINEKYKDKNFKILSVSLDDDKEKWLKALIKENMEWDNVIEEKDFNGKVAQNFFVKAIPYLVLIDEEGKIIGIDSTIEEVDKILEVKLK